MLGEVFDALGKRWTLVLGNAAQCAIEEHFDKGFYAVVFDAVPQGNPELLMRDPEAMIAAARAIRQTTLRDLAWFGLQKHHPEVTVAIVSDIIDALGQSRFGEVIGKAIAAATDMNSTDRGSAAAADPGNGGRPAKPKRPGKPGTSRSGQTGPR